MKFGVLVIENSNSDFSIKLHHWFDSKLAQVFQKSGESLEIIPSIRHTDLNDFDIWVSVVLCDGQFIDKTSSQEAAIQFSKTKGVTIFPLVQSLDLFGNLAPSSLMAYNGFEYRTQKDLPELGNLILEHLGLLRSQRKIFISYVRKESRAIALQLQERLNAHWYQVFLDTHTIRPGANFQDVLLHELADSDMMVLLDSPDIKNRPWVMEEVSFATCAGLGTLQVVWPEHRRVEEAEFFEPLFLKDFGPILFECPEEKKETHHLRSHILDEIVNQIAQQRSSAFHKREERMIHKVENFARLNHWSFVIHSGRYIIMDRGNGPCRIETMLGFPDAHRIQQAVERKGFHGCSGKTPLLYDPMAITNAMEDHLTFLEKELPIQLLSNQEIPQWIDQI